jgi:hypothetical protein
MYCMLCTICGWYVRWNASCQSSPLGIMYSIPRRRSLSCMLAACVAVSRVSNLKSMSDAFVSRRASGCNAAVQRREEVESSQVERRKVGGLGVWGG